MKYMGSKNRHAKEMLPIILKNRTDDQWYVEPFVGGFNMIDKVSGKRIANDSNRYLIALFMSLQDGWVPPYITEDNYNDIKNRIEDYPPEIVGYAAFSFSYGAKFFGGWRREKAGIIKGSIEDKENTDLQNDRSMRSIMSQKEKIRDVKIYNTDYQSLTIPENSIIYCDPPYNGTTKYKDSFNHDVFWDWVRNKVKEGHTVFVSEYDAPKDFVCIWQKKVNNTLTKDTGSKKGYEKLFIYKFSQTYEDYKIMDSFFQFDKGNEKLL